MPEFSVDEVHDAVRVAMEASLEQLLAIRSMEFGTELAPESEEADFFTTCLVLLVGKLSAYLLSALPWDVRDEIAHQLKAQVMVARKIARVQSGGETATNGSKES